MKNLSKYMTIAAAIMAVSCQKDNSPSVSDDVNFKTRLYTETSRTAFDGKTVTWESGDALALFYSCNGMVFISYNGTANVAVAGAAAEFTAELNGTPSPSADDECLLYAIYPNEAYPANSDFDKEDIVIDGQPVTDARYALCKIPETQTASQSSYDPSAGVLFGSTTVSVGSVPENALMKFDHVAAYGHMTIVLPETLGEQATVQSVSIETAEPISGTMQYFYEHNVSLATVSGSTSLTVLMPEGGNEVWFGCIPVDLSYTDVTVTLYTSEGNFKKTFKPTAMEFKAGRIGVFTVDMSACEAVSSTPAAGDVLWSDNFETAEYSSGSTSAGTVIGTYDWAASNSSCKLFNNADKSQLKYTGNYAGYFKMSGDYNSYSGVGLGHNSSSEGYIAIENIPVYGVSKVNLSFGTGSNGASMWLSYNGGEYQLVEESIQYESYKEPVSFEYTLPEGTESISIKLAGNSPYKRYFDNFVLTCVEP